MTKSDLTRCGQDPSQRQRLSAGSSPQDSMKMLLAALGGGGTLTAAVLSSSWSIALAVLAVGVLAIAAGVIFHHSDNPIERVERLIKALRLGDPLAAPPAPAHATLAPPGSVPAPRARSQHPSRSSKKRGP
ncbi:hypothetical protein GCM10022419_124260 [Nonomuraea rosea]|uniref:DUF3040 domain-containing protein n=1 Tax=Nonomuraea rosea TaxID=638574 RepID=A0ABP6ZRI2_9ACTN